MSQKHPRRRMVDGQVLDAVDFNESLRPFEEATFNEQNFSTRLKTQLARGEDFEEGTFAQSTRAGDAGNDPAGGTAVSDALAQIYSNSSTPSFGDKRIKIYEPDTWVIIETTRSSFIADAGGWLNLAGTLQLQEEIGPIGGDANETGWPMAHSVQLGVFLDGGLIYESAIGGQDRSSEAANMDQGRHLYVHGMDRETQVPVAAGAHEVALAVRAVTLHGHGLWDWTATGSTSPTGQPLILVTNAYLRPRLESR